MFFSDDIAGKKILLHACCGPCSLGAIQPLLDDGARLTLYFYNPCIVDGEYELRRDALRTVAAHYGVTMIEDRGERAEFLDYALPFSQSREGGERCGLCISDRLRAAAKYAASHGYDCYSTTLTVSPRKNSNLIFAIGDGLYFGSPFLARDFKKRDGFLLSCKLSRQLGIYRQDFCGCEFSRHIGDAVGEI